MTDKQMKRLSRRQLLQLLLEQTQRADSLEQELSEALAKIEEKRLVATEAGSLAEATLRLNRVFEAADAAAEQYIANIKRISRNADSFKERLEEDAREKADAVMAEAEKYCAEREAEMQIRIAELEEEIEGLLEKKKDLEKAVNEDEI